MYDTFEIKSAWPNGWTQGVALSADDHVVGIDYPEVAPGGGRATIWFQGTAQAFGVDGEYEIPGAINAAGAIAGSQVDPTAFYQSNLRAFVRADAVAAPLLLQPLMPSDTEMSVGGSINDSREVTGLYYAPPTPSANSWVHGFVYDVSTGEILLLDSLPHQLMDVEAINNQHDIVGQKRTGGGYVYNLQSKQFRALSFKPIALNDAGLVVGNVDDANAVKEGPLGLESIQNFGGDLFKVFDVNNDGLIVGQGTYTSGPHGSDFYGFLSNGTSTIELDAYLNPGSTQWHVFAAFAINDAGHILARARRAADRVNRTVLLVPAPAPPGSHSKLIAAFAVLFGGVSRDGGGWSFSGGHFRREPPWGPPEPGLLTAGERDAITGLMVGRLASGLHDRAARVELERAASRIVSDAGARLYAPRSRVPSSVARSGEAPAPQTLLEKLAHRFPELRLSRRMGGAGGSD